MNQSTDSETALPGNSQVIDSYATVTTSLLLTPREQRIGLGERICQEG